MLALLALMATAGVAAAIPTDVRVHYPERFPGIDLVVYANGQAIEYDWLVHPGADPAAIRMKLPGATLDPGGDLIVTTTAGLIRHTKPRSYQETGGARRTIPSEFVVKTDGTVGFRVGEYDPALPLIIDPQVQWVAAFGNKYSYDEGTLHPRLADQVSGIAIDPGGNVWLTGMAYFNGFPRINAVQSQCPGNHCTFVTKVSPDGTKILFSSFVATPVAPLRWPLLDENTYFPSALACDAKGNVYVTGASDASKLPVIAGVAQSRGGNDVFVLKLDSSGAVKARLVFGGGSDDVGTSIAVGHDGLLYVAGRTSSADFPVTPGAYRGDRAGSPNFFAVKIDPKLLDGDTAFARAVVYSSLPGFSRADPAIGADASGNAYAAGSTHCSDMGPFEPGYCGGQYGGWWRSVSAVYKLNATGTALLWAEKAFGGTGTDIRQIAVSAEGEVRIAGNTASAGFPITKSAYRNTPQSGGITGFLAKLNAGAGAIEWATYVVGDKLEFYNSPVRTLAVDNEGNAYVGGAGPGEDIPEVNSILTKFGMTRAGFLMAIKPDGTGITWSTPLGFTGPTIAAAGSSRAIYVGGNVNPGMTIANVAGQNYGNQSIEIANIKPEGAPVHIDALMNAASGEAGVPLAGGAATMFVDRPLDPARVSILVGAAPVFLMGIAGKQINFQVPYEGYGAAAAGRFPVELRYAGLSSFGLFSIAGPGIFTLEDGSAAIQHGSDYSLVTRANPAAPGETVIVYLTGLAKLGAGASQKTGVPPSAPAPARNCYPATSNGGEVLYAGVTPGVVALYQMNVRLRSDLPSGDFSFFVTRNDCSPPPPTPAYPAPGPIKRNSNTVILPIR